MKISAKNDINASAEKIYQLVSSPLNFADFLPPQVERKTCTVDYCEFSIQGMATFTVKVVEKEPHHYVKYDAENDKNIAISMEMTIQERGDMQTLLVDINAEIPLFLSTLVKNPLQNLANMIVEQVKNLTEK